MTYLNERLLSGCGILVMLFLAWLMSRNRKSVPYRTVVFGILLQGFFAWIILATDIGRPFFSAMNHVFLFLGDMGKEGARFLVGDLVDKTFLWGVLSTIIVYAAIMAVLYYLGIMQRIVYAVAWVMKRTMGISGAEAISSAANVFIGQTEAPLVIKPFLKKLTHSELMTLMTGGLATVAGGVMAACVTMLSDDIPDIAGHLMAASIMSAPAAIIFAKLMWPEDSEPETASLETAYEAMKDSETEKDYNVLDAYVRGASDGARMVFMIGGMLIAFVGGVWGANQLWSQGMMAFGSYASIDVSGFDTLQELFGYLFMPFAYLMGIPHQDIWIASELLAEKTLINEFVAYGHMAELISQDAGVMTERTQIILSYALCGFANLLSLGIQIAGISTLVPELRGTLCRIAPRALIAGTFACFQTACFAGLLL